MLKGSIYRTTILLGPVHTVTSSLRSLSNCLISWHPWLILKVKAPQNWGSLSLHFEGKKTHSLAV